MSEDTELRDALGDVTPEFHARWCEYARRERPHQEPPTLDQMIAVLSMLEPEDIRGIIQQFDDIEVRR